MQTQELELDSLRKSVREHYGNVAERAVAGAVSPTISTLPEPYREALVLTEFEGLTQKEMAERLGISLSGSKSRVQGGQEQLKQMLLERCDFEFDRLGRIIDCKPRAKDACQGCA